MTDLRYNFWFGIVGIQTSGNRMASRIMPWHRYRCWCGVPHYVGCVLQWWHVEGNLGPNAIQVCSCLRRWSKKSWICCERHGLLHASGKSKSSLGKNTKNIQREGWVFCAHCSIREGSCSSTQIFFDCVLQWWHAGCHVEGHLNRRSIKSWIFCERNGLLHVSGKSKSSRGKKTKNVQRGGCVVRAHFVIRSIGRGERIKTQKDMDLFWIIISGLVSKSLRSHVKKVFEPPTREDFCVYEFVETY